MYLLDINVIMFKCDLFCTVVCMVYTDYVYTQLLEIVKPRGDGYLFKQKQC